MSDRSVAVLPINSSGATWSSSVSSVACARRASSLSVASTSWIWCTPADEMAIDARSPSSMTRMMPGCNPQMRPPRRCSASVASSTWPTNAVTRSSGSGPRAMQFHEAASLQQVRDDVDHLGVLAEVADLNQVGMRHLQGAGLAEKARAHGLAIGTPRMAERANRDRMPERAVRAGVNLRPEAPLRDDRPQLERAQQRRHGLRHHPRHGRLGIVEGPGEVHHRRPPLVGLLGQRPHHRVAHLGGQVGPPLRERDGHGIDVPIDQHHEAVALDGPRAGQQLVDDHAEAVSDRPWHPARRR